MRTRGEKKGRREEESNKKRGNGRAEERGSEE